MKIGCLELDPDSLLISALTYVRAIEIAYCRDHVAVGVHDGYRVAGVPLRPGSMR